MPIFGAAEPLPEAVLSDAVVMRALLREVAPQGKGQIARPVC